MTNDTSLPRQLAVHLRGRTQSARRDVKAAVRKMAAPVCLEPTFLVIGAMKAGTTSLHRYLSQHPAIGVSAKKEVLFFNAEYRRGQAWYRGHFPSRSFRRRVRRSIGVEPAIGEATTHYLIDPRVPPLVHDYNPDLKLIALLRDPVSRAYSHHQHQLRMGLEHLSFEEALEAEAGRLAGELERMLADPTYESLVRRRKSYLTSGRYIEHVERWLELFPRDQLLLLCSEDLYENPASVMSEVVRFLEVPAWDDWEFEVWNEGTYEPMSDGTREFLAGYYEEPNQRLYALLGRDLGWTRPSSLSAGREAISSVEPEPSR